MATSSNYIFPRSRYSVDGGVLTWHALTTDEITMNVDALYLGDWAYRNTINLEPMPGDMYYHGQRIDPSTADLENPGKGYIAFREDDD